MSVKKEMTEPAPTNSAENTAENSSQQSPTFIRERPSAFRKLFFKGPKYVYWGPMASFLASRCVMMLTTTGRSSGLPRKTGISFMPVDDGYVVFTGWGIKSDWYKNLRKNPEVTIQVGQQSMPATAHLVEDPERRKALMQQMKDQSDQCGPPPFVRSVLKATHIFDYDNELQIALDQGGDLAVVEIIPTR